ncbi:hypothetical protein ASB7_13940 [Helicobacter ailurogastricus]|nr:hypothetical protein ASB7_13940 [Helicobacter ailurogastricus]
MTKAQFYIEGMTCSACSSGIERSLGRKAYVKEVGVDLLSKKPLWSMMKAKQV